MPRMTGSTRRLVRNTRTHMFTLVVHFVTNHWSWEAPVSPAMAALTTLILDRAGAGAGGRLSVSHSGIISTKQANITRSWPGTAEETGWLGRAGIHGYWWLTLRLSAPLCRDWERRDWALLWPLPGSSHRVWKQENLLMSCNKYIHNVLHTINAAYMNTQNKVMTSQGTQMSRLCFWVWQDDLASPSAPLRPMTGAIVKRSKQNNIKSAHWCINMSTTSFRANHEVQRMSTSFALTSIMLNSQIKTSIYVCSWWMCQAWNWQLYSINNNVLNLSPSWSNEKPPFFVFCLFF